MGTGADKHMSAGARAATCRSYIPTAHFATAFIDFVARGAATAGADATHGGRPDRDRRPAAQAGRAAARRTCARTVIAGIDYANGDIAKVRKAVEQWFDGAMDRASGWYKRRTQALLFIVGLLAAVVLNVDALHILHRLTADKTFRDVVVSRAAAAKAARRVGARRRRARAITLRAASSRPSTMPIGWEAASADNDAFPLWPTQFCSARAVSGGAISERLPLPARQPSTP